MSKAASNSAGNATRAKTRLFVDMLMLFTIITLAIAGFRQQMPPPDSDTHRADPPKDQGDFKLYCEPYADPRSGIAGHRIGINQQAVEGVIDSLNERMVLPFDIPITLKKCDRPDASYDDQTHEIMLSYELIDDYYALFSNRIRDEAKLDDAVRGAVAFTFFHEMGHALIHAWDLPITGREEDAADQLSNLILIEQIEDGEQMALDGALSLKLYADLAKWDEKIYWDEHSLDEQRFYDIICILYGHDPEKYSYLIKDGALPKERAELCNREYAKFKMSWQTLLAPYLKTTPGAASKIHMR